MIKDAFGGVMIYLFNRRESGFARIGRVCVGAGAEVEVRNIVWSF